MIFTKAGECRLVLDQPPALVGWAVASIEPSGGSSGAIATSRADESALVRFVERHVHEMAQPQRKIFRDLYWLGLEVGTLPHFFDDETDGLGI